MRRKDMASNPNAISEEFQAVWDDIRKIKQTINTSILPEGFVWDSDGDALVIISPSGSRTTIT